MPCCHHSAPLDLRQPQQRQQLDWGARHTLWTPPATELAGVLHSIVINSNQESSSPATQGGWVRSVTRNVPYLRVACNSRHVVSRLLPAVTMPMNKTTPPAPSPTLSVIVATFNEEKTIAECVRRIFAVFPDDCEVLVVDGGDDRTGEIVSALTPDFSGLRSIFAQRKRSRQGARHQDRNSSGPRPDHGRD